ncbi:MAG: hypothetical protein R3B51_10755 [Thermodesulfobacteriota bacterium]
MIAYNGTSGLETAVIRPSNVWGAGDTVILPASLGLLKRGYSIPWAAASAL